MLNVWKFFFIIIPAVTLVLPKSYFAGPFFLAIAGFFYQRQAADNTPVRDQILQKSWFWMLGGFGWLVISGVGLAIWHSNHLGHYEMYIPFVLFPVIAWLIRAGRWNVEPWVLSIAVGAFLAFLYATYQVQVQTMARAQGAAGNPIPFGNTAILFGALSSVVGMMFPFEGVYARWKRIFCLAAGFAGLGASLLSGSKGGWLALLLVIAAAVYWGTKHWPAWRRGIFSLSTMGALVMVVILMPSQSVKDRLFSGLEGAWHWVQTGEVTEGSVSMRLEIWRLSSIVISEKPLLGHGSVGAHQRWDELRQQTGASPMLAQLFDGKQKFVSSDNELIGALEGGGLLGAFGLFVVYAGVWLAFRNWRNHPDAQIKTLSVMGRLLVFLYLGFGFSVSVLGINLFRSLFVFLSITLLTLLSVRINKIRGLL